MLCRPCHTALHAAEVSRTPRPVRRISKDRLKELRRIGKDDLATRPRDYVWTMLAALFLWLDGTVEPS